MSLRKSKKKPAVKQTKPDYNLVISYDPNHKQTAQKEVEDIFSQAKEKIQLSESGIDGLFLGRVKDARKAITKITKVFYKNPAAFITTHHFTPIDTWASSDTSQLLLAVSKIASHIGVEEKWRMSINKRRYKENHTDLILKLTQTIDRPHIDLANPERIIHIDIIGDKAGISLLKPSDIIIVDKLRLQL